MEGGFALGSAADDVSQCSLISLVVYVVEFFIRI